MSKQSEKALKRLDAALLDAAPEETDPLDAYEKDMQRKQHYKAYNADRIDGDLESYSQQLLKPRRRVSWLAVLLLLGLLAGAAWLLWQQGVISW